MQRDLELIREILLTIEADDFSRKTRFTVDSFIPNGLSDDAEISDDPRANSPYEQAFNKVSYHIELLLDENFIEATEFPIRGTEFNDFIIKRITASGHDYLDSIRDDNVWTHTKEKLGGLATSVTLSTITAVAQSYIHQKLGI